MNGFATILLGFLKEHLLWSCLGGAVVICLMACAIGFAVRRRRGRHSVDRSEENGKAIEALREGLKTLLAKHETLLKERENLLARRDTLVEKLHGIHREGNNTDAFLEDLERQIDCLLRKCKFIEDQLPIIENQIAILQHNEDILASREDRLLCCNDAPAREVEQCATIESCARDMKEECMSERMPLLQEEMDLSSLMTQSAEIEQMSMLPGSLDQNAASFDCLKFAGTVGIAAEQACGSDVGVGVVAPATASRGESVMVQVVGDLFKDLPATIEKAKELDSTNHAVERGSLPIRGVKEGAEMLFRLDMPQLLIEEDERIQKHVWDGMPFSLQFFASVPDQARIGTCPARLIVSVDGRPVGRIGFVINVVERDSIPAAPAATTPLGYKEFFVSYSDKDLDRVLPRVQGLRIAERDFHFFFDKLSLHPGERYEPAILDYIDHKADVFLLFWSANAAVSKWVEKEWRRALARQSRTGGIPDIVPVPLDMPSPKPPPELSNLHFGDSLLALSRNRNE